MVVARTLTADAFYDVRFDDGSVVKYLREQDLDPILAEAASDDEAASED